MTRKQSIRCAFCSSLWVAVVTANLVIRVPEALARDERTKSQTAVRSVSIPSKAAKVLSVPREIRRAAAISGFIRVSVEGRGVSGLVLSSLVDSGAARLKTRRSSSLWELSYVSGTVIRFENVSDKKLRVNAIFSARGKPRRTPTPTATSTSTATPTNTPDSGPTATPTHTPAFDEQIPNVGHARSCAKLKQFVPDRILYVATNGSDENPGSTELPWLTLQKACNSVRPGDAVYVRTGIYKGCTITTSGLEEKPITIQAAPLSSGYEEVTINGKSGSTSPFHGVLNAEGASWVTFRGFRVTGNDARTGIRIVAGTGQSICENTILDSQVWGVLGGFTTYALVEDNDIFRPAQQHGIYFGEGDDYYVIRGNYIEQPNQICMHNNGSGGMNTGALIEKNICYKAAANGGAQLNMDGVEKSVVRNNIFYGGSRNAIALFNQDGELASRYNWIIGNSFHFTGNTGYFAIAVNDNAIGNKLYNNVLYRTPNGFRGSLAVDPTALVDFESDYNVFAGSGLGAVNHEDSVTEDRPISLSQWQAMGYDTHSIVVADSELFTNSLSGDFSLKAGSPAKAAGVTKHPYLYRDILDSLRGEPSSIGAFD